MHVGNHPLHLAKEVFSGAFVQDLSSQPLLSDLLVQDDFNPLHMSFVYVVTLSASNRVAQVVISAHVSAESSPV